MGMPIAQSTQPISQQQPGGKNSQQYQSNPQGGKGMAQPTGLRPQGDYGDPNLIQSLPAQAQQYAPSVVPQGGEDFTAPMGGPNGRPQQYQGKGGSTNSATSGQPRMGQANPYSNTIQPWDNGNNQTQSGKGKGH